MSIFEAVRSVITNFKDFHGRARRSEFWWYYLFECITQRALRNVIRGKGEKNDLWG